MTTATRLIPHDLETLRAWHGARLDARRFPALLRDLARLGYLELAGGRYELTDAGRAAVAGGGR